MELVGDVFDGLEAQLLKLDVNFEEKWPMSNKLSIAIQFREMGKYQAAQDWLNKFLTGEPRDAEAWSLLSHVYMLDKKDSEAEKALSNAVLINDELPSVYLNQARFLLRKSKPEAALLKAQSCYERSIEDPESWLVLAACLGANKRDQEALPLIERALKARPNYAEAYANRGMLRLRAKNISGAREDLEMATSLKPHLAQLWGLLGTLYHQSNNLSGAIEALKKAHENESANVNYMIDLGEFLRQNKNTKEAICILKEATKVAPENANTWINLGAAFQQNNEIANAKFAYEKALAIKPNSAEISNNLGTIAKDAGDKETALKYFEQAIAINPELADAHNNFGVILQELGKIEEAELSYRRAVSLDQGFAEAFSNLGNTLKELGRLEDAETCYRKAIAEKPEFAEFHNNLGATLQELGKLEETEMRYKKAISLKSNYFSAHYSLGVWFFEQGRYEEAAEQLFNSKNFKNSQSYLLKYWYFLNNPLRFYEQFDSLVSQGEINAIIGSFGCRAGIRYGTVKPNPFCNEPLNYLLKSDLCKEYDFSSKFIKPILSILNDKEIHNRSQNLLTNGFQTAGNLFNLENFLIGEIKSIIELKIEEYRLYFKDSNEGFINNWPDSYSLHGWVINMKSGGELRPHMHEKGWLSGSIYINVPAKSNSNDGNLVVCLEDDQYLTESQKNKQNIIDVTTGCLCLFPASLLHYTIPFESDEDRIVLAFDVLPK